MNNSYHLPNTCDYYIIRYCKPHFTDEKTKAPVNQNLEVAKPALEPHGSRLPHPQIHAGSRIFGP